MNRQKPGQELLAPPESYVKNYDRAVKEKKIALNGGTIVGKALQIMFGWDPMPAMRYNNAMTGVERELKLSQRYDKDNLHLLRTQAIEDMETESAGRLKFVENNPPLSERRK